MRRAPLIISILALVLAASGVAISAPKDANGVIHACYSQSDVDAGDGNLLYLVNAGEPCPAETPTAISWNATGPQGATGAPGQTGPTGATGAPGPQGTPAPAPLVPATQVEKVDAAEKKTDTAKEKLEEVAKKLEESGKGTSSADLTKFMQAVQTMVNQIVAAQNLSLKVLKSMPASEARDRAVKQAQAQIAAAQALIPKLAALLKDKKLTKSELDQLYARLPVLLAALADGQSALNDGVANRITDVVKPPSTKKP